MLIETTMKHQKVKDLYENIAQIVAVRETTVLVRFGCVTEFVQITKITVL